MCKEIQLTRGLVALVDDEDYDELSKYKWSFDGRSYARRREGGASIRMHIQLMGKIDGLEIDHINGNKADNRISNLREASRVKNQQNQISAYKSNSTGLLGVSQHKPGVWRARLCVSGKNKSLGLFSSPELAHEAYKEAKRVFHEGCTI